MIDIEKLKALAEAAKEDWCNWYTLDQLERQAVDGAGAELIVSATPAAVLELIARVEALTLERDRLARDYAALLEDTGGMI